MEWPSWAWAVVSYFIGGVPTAYLIGKATRGVDVRSVGTRNVGAANVTREVGRWQGAVVLAADAGKGALCVAVARAAGDSDWGARAAALAAVAGHNVSPFLRFYGGKGVSTAFGVAIGMWPVVGALFAVLPAAAVAAVTRNPVAAFAAGALSLGVALQVTGPGFDDVALWGAITALVTGTAYWRARAEWHGAVTRWLMRGRRR
jgi:glycerol-3-phosphate acyltransferase PlsY